jgi:hypothetical protein
LPEDLRIILALEIDGHAPAVMTEADRACNGR